MIISHQHRFIFIKTIKTAGTSLEIALSSVCGPKDVITPITPSDELLRVRNGFRGAQNYEKPFGQWSRREIVRFGLRRRRPEPLFYNHMPAVRIRSLVSDEVWRSYFKFTLVRNPWDRTVSQYFWKNRKTPAESMPSFHDFLLSAPHLVQENWPIYTEGSQMLADGIIRYESFQDGLEEVSEKIGLPPGLFKVFNGTRAKAQHRSTDFLMTESDADLVGRLAEREVRAFGYAAPPSMIRVGKPRVPQETTP